MATPLTPIPPNPPPAQADSRRSLRTTIGAGLGAIAIAAAVTAAPGTAFAQDTYAQDNAWVPEVVNAPDVWGTTQGEGVTVAVMDTGINDHPFFEGKNILPGYSSFSDEEDGWNDQDGHGSGVAAAVLLAAPEATIMPVRIGTGASVLSGAMGPVQWDAFYWAVDNGADVLVVPWIVSGVRSSFDGGYLECLQYAVDNGVIVVGSAGNDPNAEIAYPAWVPGVLTVTGANSSGDIWYENTTVGPEVDVAAPADAMTVPLPQDSALGNTELYAEVIGGTSMGTGVVGGVAALTWAAHPDLDANNVIQRLLLTSGDGSGNRSDDVGYGLVNAERAVNADGIEPVDENPLGYPMGEPGVSGSSDETSDTDEGEAAPGVGPSGPSETPQANKESNLSTIIVVAAAVVLIGAAIAVWLVLRGRGRKSAAAAEQPGAFNADNGPAPGGYQQPAPPQQQFGPPPGGGQQGYASPPPGPQGYSSPPNGPQGFTPPPGGGEQSPPWRPGDRQ
ncbi:S8 family serine peptidase [Glycomyces sp. NRRL B-16210]|uniref:S8 family serine peptidase n=1 Tax=Glycomyces sp. NRRL B-16210 TaxID=1463821 RepID=UPI0004BEADD5|nr:S8 family serine peptidase [Glycomyces sp. NRRL B-16210]